MAVYSYRKFKVSISEDSKKTQGLHVGDIVRRQYFDSPNLIYSLMCVLETGTDTVTVIENGESVQKERPWFIGALLEGDAPMSGELLDFVRVTNLWDANRLGAIYMTASDEQSPYIDVIDGIPVEQSLCYPSSINNVSWTDYFSQYTIVGRAYVTATYQKSYLDNYRICSFVRNSVTANTGTFIGLQQHIEKTLGNPDRVLISYKIKSNRTLNNIIASLGYTDGSRIDGTLNVTSTTEWTYQLHAITVDFSDRYQRMFSLNVNDNLSEGDTVEISDLNIVLLSSVANFAGGLKMRLGKLNGINDPVFGTLDNYGAYMQRLYATQQVNISGTLTAGDENGFGCTFYAGKIHKNVVINSVACDFDSATSIVATSDNPVGVGEVYSSDRTIILNAQTNAWMLGKLGKQYCFSFWLKTDTDCDILISQNGYSIRTIIVEGNGTWQRYSVAFTIQAPNQDVPLQMSLQQSEGTIYFTAPQIEKGKYATQYQPTDDVLSYVEDYGAWFNKGGIGGTIQNPLLKLNDDGSISSRDNSFIINNDGTGQFANGRFKWTKDKILLQDVTIKWEDLDETTQEAIKPKSIRILGPTVFVQENDTYAPTSITLQISETNFVSTSSGRKWYYLSSSGDYVLLEGENGRTLTILPTASYWQEKTILTIKCVVTINSSEYSDTITIQKTKNGENVYSVLITASRGTILKDGVEETTLTASVYYGNEEVTNLIPDNMFSWVKESGNSESDTEFAQQHEGYGRNLTVRLTDLINTAKFGCKVAKD